MTLYHTHQSLYRFLKRSTILLYNILNGKGSSNWLWPTWAQSSFRTDQSNIVVVKLKKKFFSRFMLFVCLFCYICKLYSSAWKVRIRVSGTQGCLNTTSILLVYYINQHVPYVVAFVNCSHVGSATASFKGLITVAQENFTNETAGVLVQDQLQPASLGWVTVSQE